MTEAVNEVRLVGRAGADAELRYTASGQAMVNVRLAISRMVMVDREARTYREQTDWIRVQAWGEEVGERQMGIVRKGDLVEIHGRLSTRSWDGDDGQKRYAMDVVAQTVAVVEQAARRPNAAQSAQATAQRVANEAARERSTEPDPDDLPFE